MSRHVALQGRDSSQVYAPASWANSNVTVFLFRFQLVEPLKDFLDVLGFRFLFFLQDFLLLALSGFLFGQLQVTHNMVMCYFCLARIYQTRARV